MADNYNLIDDPKKLHKLCFVLNSLSEQDLVSIDTEFERSKTYYPKLLLIQLCIDDYIYLVDPLAKIDLKAFFSSINNCKAKFLFFSCSEDLEIIALMSRRLQLSKILPDNCLDLQLLMAFLNLSFSKGLQASVLEFLNIELKKDQTLSDWSVRPLSDAQLIYAKEDVQYLKALYLALLEKANKDDIRLKWFIAEMESVKEKSTTILDPDTCYKVIPQAGSLSLKQLNMLRVICKMRAIVALEKDESLNRVVTTKALCQIVKKKHLNFKILQDCNMKFGAIKSYGNELITWFDHALKMEVDKSIEPALDYIIYKHEYALCYKALKKHLKQASLKYQICQELVTNKNLCNDFFYKILSKQTPILQSSWYFECVGKIEFDKKLMLFNFQKEQCKE